MKQKRHKPEEIIRLLREADSGDLNQEAFFRQKQIPIATLHQWPKKYGHMSETDGRRLKALEKENAELKKMYTEAMLGIKVLKETIEKSFEPRSSPRSCQTGQEGGRLLSTEGSPFL